MNWTWLIPIALLCLAALGVLAWVSRDDGDDTF